MAEKILNKKKEIKLTPQEREFIFWLINEITNYRRRAAISEKHYSDYLDQVLRKNKEIPSDKWDIDLQKGIIFEKGVPIIGGNNNGNKSK